VSPEAVDPVPFRISRGIWPAAFWLPWAVCTWLAFAPSLTTGPVTLSDKSAHFLAFGYLMLALSLAHFTKASPLFPAVLLVGYGIGIEGVQALLPTRQAEGADLAADLLGIAAGWMVLLALRRFTPSLARAGRSDGK
jgi:VanZ family protein